MRRSPLPSFCRRPAAAAQRPRGRARPSRRSCLAFGAVLAWLALAAAPIRAQPAPPDTLTALRDSLSRAGYFLCADCHNDIEAEGVNRPMRRVMLAAGDLDRAESLAEDAAAEGAPHAIAVLVEIRAAREALESLDEAEVLVAIGRALLLLGR
jgi:hypothetical protein